jgi:hypothetical protein
MINETPGTLPPTANIPDYSAQPRNMRLTPRGATSTPMSRRFPRVLGGQCEFCGTLDPHQPGDLQYKLCPHYRGMDLKCVYCPPNKDQEEVVRNSTLNVAEHPYRPGELLVWCQSFECVKKHEQAFKTSN